MFDMIIIGGGPAGLTAAIYARRAEKTVLVLEKESFGGQISFSPKVENIPGFTSLSGTEFADRLVEQAIYQGAEFEVAEAVSIAGGPGGKDGEPFKVSTDIGDFEGRSVILATGAKHRRLGLPGEDGFIGDGISFCAVCDGAFYKDRTVGIVGGGNSALQEAILLSDLVKKLYVFQDLPELTGEKKLQDELRSKDNVEILTKVRVAALLTSDNGTDAPAFGGVTVETEDGAKDYPLDGLFVAIGLVPQNGAFSDRVALDGRGYIPSDESCVTDAAGIFAAGDCRAKRIRQVATAAADGASAAVAACAYIEGRG